MREITFNKGVLFLENASGYPALVRHKPIFKIDDNTQTIYIKDFPKNCRESLISNYINKATLKCCPIYKFIFDD